MRNVFIGFLGLGQKKGQDKNGNDIFDYESAEYTLNGKTAEKTQFVQVAEIELLGAKTFDRIIIIATPKSYHAHFSRLVEQLNHIGVDRQTIFNIQIDENMSAQGQWAWFEEILYHIDPNDELTVDLTHGYRIGSIVFTAAVYFLQTAKNVRLKAVYYGAFEKNRKNPPIIDMKDFFNINQWAEAVSRLVEDADARKLAQIAETSPELQAKDLNDAELIQALDELTNTVRNVDINNVSKMADKALALIQNKQEHASTTGKILLKAVIDKFSSLSSQVPLTGNYDAPYFYTQLEVIKLLNQHKLYMQSFTAMREFIGSIGLIQVKKANIRNENGRKQRRKAEIFLRMLCNVEEKWNFSSKDDLEKPRVMPLYERLKSEGIEQELRKFVVDLTNYRNGFDHAWTSKKEPPTDIEEKAFENHAALEKVIAKLKEIEIL